MRLEPSCHRYFPGRQGQDEALEQNFAALSSGEVVVVVVCVVFAFVELALRVADFVGDCC